MSTENQIRAIARKHFLNEARANIDFQLPKGYDRWRPKAGSIEEWAQKLMEFKSDATSKLIYGKAEDYFLNDILTILVEKYKENPTEKLEMAIGFPFLESDIMKEQVVNIFNSKSRKGYFSTKSHNFQDLYHRVWSWTFLSKNEKTGLRNLLSIVEKSYSLANIYKSVLDFAIDLDKSDVDEKYKIIANEMYAERKTAAEVSELHKNIFPSAQDVVSEYQKMKGDPKVVRIGKDAFDKNNVPSSAMLKYDPSKPEELSEKRDVANFMGLLIRAIKMNAYNVYDDYIRRGPGAISVSLDEPISGDEGAESLISRLKVSGKEYEPEENDIKLGDTHHQKLASGEEESENAFEDEAGEESNSSNRLQKAREAFKKIIDEFKKYPKASPLLTVVAEGVFVQGKSYDQISSEHPDLYANAKEARVAISQFKSMIESRGPEFAKFENQVYKKYGMSPYMLDRSTNTYSRPMFAVPINLWFKTGKQKAVEKPYEPEETEDLGSKRYIYEADTKIQTLNIASLNESQFMKLIEFLEGDFMQLSESDIENYATKIGTTYEILFDLYSKYGFSEHGDKEIEKIKSLFMKRHSIDWDKITKRAEMQGLTKPNIMEHKVRQEIRKSFNKVLKEQNETENSEWAN